LTTSRLKAVVSRKDLEMTSNVLEIILIACLIVWLLALVLRSPNPFAQFAAWAQFVAVVCIALLIHALHPVL